MAARTPLSNCLYIRATQHQHTGISSQLIWQIKPIPPRKTGAGRTWSLRQPTPPYFCCETVMRAMASWQTCFAMPVRCDLLAQHPFTVSSSNGRQRSSLRQTREVGERTAWCASDPRCVRIISTHPATPCLTQHRADSRHRHRPSRDDAVLATPCTDCDPRWLF